MPLQPQQQQKFWNRLTNAVAQPVCPFCQTPLNQGNIAEIVEAPAVSHPGHAAHMLQLICNHCAFVSLFSIFVKGNVLQFETTVIPQRTQSAKKKATAKPPVRAATPGRKPTRAR